MKTLIFLLSVLTLFSSGGQGQSKSEKKFRKYNIRLTTMNEDKISGRLSHVTDSAIVIEVSEFNSRKVELGHPLDTISYSSISQLTLHNRSGWANGMGIGMGLGAGIGLLIGDAVGHAALKEHPPTGLQLFDPIDDYLINGALIGMVGGGLIGAGIGASVNKNFDINGDFGKFLEMKERMKF